MRKLLLVSLLFLVIPFFVVFFFLQELEQLEEPTTIMVKVKREATGEIEVVNLEDYIVGVVAGEMPISFQLEALKAQAVAARSYVLKRKDNTQNQDYDVVDTVNNQVYLDEQQLKKSWGVNYAINFSKLKEAVFLTAGEVLMYENTIVDALYFSTSNGFTENSEEIFSNKAPYLRSVESVWDEKVSPVFNDHKIYKQNEFYQKIGLKPQSKLIIEIRKKSSTGRILELKINGELMTGSTVATKLQLRSNHFVIEQEGETIIIKTTGYGHGVGMSQYGAEGMAQEGYDYQAILKYYYQGTEIKKLDYSF